MEDQESRQSVSGLKSLSRGRREECNHDDHRKIQMIKGEDSKQVTEEKSILKVVTGGKITC